MTLGLAWRAASALTQPTRSAAAITGLQQALPMGRHLRASPGHLHRWLAPSALGAPVLTLPVQVISLRLSASTAGPWLPGLVLRADWFLGLRVSRPFEENL